MHSVLIHHHRHEFLWTRRKFILDLKFTRQNLKPRLLERQLTRSYER